MDCGRKLYRSGVVCLFSEENRVEAFQDTVFHEIQNGDFGFALVFFSKTHWAAHDVKTLMQNAASGLKYAACSTAGEITPEGLVDEKIIVVLFDNKNFETSAFKIGNRDGTNMEEVASLVAAKKNNFLASAKSEEKTYPFVVCLMDGMSYMEETVTAALHWGLDDVPLLGGSAGDNLNFKDTCLILDGETVEHCAVILMVNSKIPIKVFKTDNFIPTTKKLVVTQSEPNKRIVHEFNGLPAAQVYAATVGAEVSTLTTQSFASHPLVVRVGGEYYCRSIQKVNDDGSLTFFCAIDDGIVLTVAEPTGMARSTEKTINDVKTSLGGIDFVLGFDCVLRQIDARNRQVTHKISKIYKDNNVIGFNTYGEQYRSMHLNQTFTGIAFGVADDCEKPNVA